MSLNYIRNYRIQIQFLDGAYSENECHPDGNSNVFAPFFFRYKSLCSLQRSTSHHQTRNTSGRKYHRSIEKLFSLPCISPNSTLVFLFYNAQKYFNSFYSLCKGDTTFIGCTPSWLYYLERKLYSCAKSFIISYGCETDKWIGFIKFRVTFPFLLG